MKRRVLHVVEALTAGGIETPFLHMLRAFPDASSQVLHDVMALQGGPLEEAYRAAAHDLLLPSTGAEINAVLDRGYDVVHVLFERCADRVLPYVLARGGAGVVYSKDYDQAAMYRMEGGFQWTAEESLLAACDAVTFNTSQLAALYDLPPGRATVLGKAFAFETFSRIADTMPDAPNRILCVANLHPQKRVWDLAPMLRAVRARVPDAEVRVVGGGSAEAFGRVRDAAVAAGVADAFVLAGTRLDVAAELTAARVLVLPSAGEGVPTVLLEGMAAGRPVIATRVGHIESVVTDGREGFLVAPRDVDALASCAIRLLTDRALAAELGAAGRVRAEACDVRIVARKLLSVLLSVVSERRAAA